jgi:hypothetical protein
MVTFKVPTIEKPSVEVPLPVQQFQSPAAPAFFEQSAN